MKTFLNKHISKSTRGILYICDFDSKKMTIDVVNEIQFKDAFTALQYYAEIPNPESQLVTGKTYDELIANLDKLHKNLKNPKWLKHLKESI